MNEKKWFKRKLYGYGWYPATWEGFAVIALYVGLLLLLVSTIGPDVEGKEVVFMSVIPMVLLTSALIRVSYTKGEKPRWQWGKDLGDPK